jgi:hypothetical protein
MLLLFLLSIKETLERKIWIALPPTIIDVTAYVNKERVRYLSILTYFSYGKD